MTTFLNVIIFFMVWWIVLFAVLPWGATPSSSFVKGQARSAPARPRLLLKFFVTTGLSLLIWWGVLKLIEVRWFFETL